MEELFILLLVLGGVIAGFVVVGKTLLTKPVPHAGWTWGAFFWGPLYYLFHGLHKKGAILLVAGFALGALSYGLLAIPFWIYCGIDAGKAFGRKFYLAEEAERQDREARDQIDREMAERRKAEAEQSQRKIIEARRKEHQQRTDALRVSGSQLSKKFAQLSVLVQTDVMDHDEAETERRRLVAEGIKGWTDEDLPTFLSPFAELVQQGMCSSADLKMVKGLYATINKQRPSMAGD